MEQQDGEARVYVVNRGNAEATNVKARIGVTISQGPKPEPTTKTATESYFEFPYIRPNDRKSIFVSIPPSVVTEKVKTEIENKKTKIYIFGWVEYASFNEPDKVEYCYVWFPGGQGEMFNFLSCDEYEKKYGKPVVNVLGSKKRKPKKPSKAS